MNPTSQQLIQHLKSLKTEKQHLNELLQADPEKCFVYYLVPFPNLVQILESGGILPRNYANPQVDLSDPGIQNLRTNKIMSKGNGESTQINLHDCINFFLNPFNNTYFQFRRNGLMRSYGWEACSRLVCLLEIDLEQLLQKRDVYWWVTPKNHARLASQKTNSHETYSKYDWKKIFAVKDVKASNDNKQRSAEWIIYYNQAECKHQIPIHSIHRILAYEVDLHGLKNSLSKFTNIKVMPFKDLYSNPALANPLNYDKRLYRSFTKLNETIDLVNLITQAVSRIKYVEQEIGLSLVDSFTTKYMANNSQHGIGHVLRVMFWVLVLAGLSNQHGDTCSQEEIQAALFGAFIHDLCRDDNTVNEAHGTRASLRFKDKIKELLPVSMAERCLKAVRLHSIDRPGDTTDVIVQLLLDADALDRGRFAPPDKNGGCLAKNLRLRLYKNEPELKRNLMWAAYWLAKVTRFIHWQINPCTDFLNILVASTYYVSISTKTDPGEGKFTTELHRSLRKC